MTERPSEPNRRSVAESGAHAADAGPAGVSQSAAAAIDTAKKKKDSLYEYLPLECPNCGFQGRAKISRLDRTFNCKQCGKVFHLTVKGANKGERPPEEIELDPSLLVEVQPPNRLEKWFGRLPPKARWAVLGGAVLGVAALFMLFKKAQLDPLPSDHLRRAALAGEAVAKGDWRTLERLAMPGTSEALREWYDSVPRDGLSGVTTESNVSAKVGAMSKMFRRAEKNEKGKKTPVADFRTPIEVRLPEQVDAPSVLRVEFVWIENSRGRWQIDGEWMLKHGKKYVKVEGPARAAGQAGGGNPAGGAIK